VAVRGHVGLVVGFGLWDDDPTVGASAEVGEDRHAPDDFRGHLFGGASEEIGLDGDVVVFEFTGHENGSFKLDCINAAVWIADSAVQIIGASFSVK
jgi:hypothetical protein